MENPFEAVMVRNGDQKAREDGSTHVSKQVWSEPRNLLTKFG
jgi:hypothetical protein